MTSHLKHAAFFCFLACPGLAAASTANEMQRISHFEIDRTEVTIGAMQAYAKATGFVSAAERAGGGQSFERGWVQRKGWTWRTPFGKPASDQEPAVHLTHSEAAGFCAWGGKRLPTDAEWVEAAYTERREQPTDGFERGKTYAFPTGNSPRGANCLVDCGEVRTVAPIESLQGKGHATVGNTQRGVNGLYDMGANAWEWVAGQGLGDPKTRGGSWWYGSAQMRASHVQTKPQDTAVVYIGFRCARSLPK